MVEESEGESLGTIWGLATEKKAKPGLEKSQQVLSLNATGPHGESPRW